MITWLNVRLFHSWFHGLSRPGMVHADSQIALKWYNNSRPKQDVFSLESYTLVMAMLWAKECLFIGDAEVNGERGEDLLIGSGSQRTAGLTSELSWSSILCIWTSHVTSVSPPRQQMSPLSCSQPLPLFIVFCVSVSETLDSNRVFVPYVLEKALVKTVFKWRHRAGLYRSHYHHQCICTLWLM